MNIALLGWYYQNNAGDDRILETVKEKLESYDNINIKIFIAWKDLDEKKDEINSCDFLLIGGGGLILRGTNYVKDLLEKIRIPFALIGISIDSVGKDNINFINYLSQKSVFILVRDSYSFSVFQKFTDKNLFLGTDLTFLNPIKATGNDIITKDVAVSLRNWQSNPFPQYSKNYHTFNKIQNKLPILKNILFLWNDDDFFNILKNFDYNYIAFPLYINDKNGDNIYLKKFFDAVEAKFDINILLKSHFLIGMRLHSLIFATQIGKPFVAIGYASKIFNYLKDIDCLDLYVPINNYKKTIKKIEYLRSNYDEISLKLIKKTNILTNKINNLFDNLYNQYIK